MTTNLKNFPAVTQTQAPAITDDHPAKPWNTDYCIEYTDILSALTISPSDGRFSNENDLTLFLLALKNG